MTLKKTLRILISVALVLLCVLLALGAYLLFSRPEFSLTGLSEPQTPPSEEQMQAPPAQEPAPAPEVIPEPEPAPEPETAPEAEPETEAEPEAEPEVESEAEAEAPAEETEPEAEQEPAPAPEELAAALAEADLLAAGYDYEAAAALLQALPGWEEAPEITEALAAYETAAAELKPYSSMSTITHIFFHSLIVDTDRAFDGDSDSEGYNMYMNTIAEFEAILEILYNKGYVLVSPYDVAYEVTYEDGSVGFTYGEILLPEGKTPFMMSQDDVNYYGYMIGSTDGINEIPAKADTYGDGFAHRIIIDEDGLPTCEYMQADGTIVTGDYDLVPILNRFIAEHPDFSYRGARAILAFTGYEGVLGYRTKPSYEGALGSEAYAAEVEAAKAVAATLREQGWDLASHSYGHINYGTRGADRVAADSDKWESTVESIIGETDIILYPHGSDIEGLTAYTFDNLKFAALYEDGFRYYFTVDSSLYFHDLGDVYFRGGRRNLDGYRMYHHPYMVEDLFAIEEVWDPARPATVATIG